MLPPVLSKEGGDHPHSTHRRGKEEFWNKERGWFDGHLAIELEAAR